MLNRHPQKLLNLIADLGDVLCLSALQHALPVLLGPMGRADMDQSWEQPSKFQDTPSEAEASASLGESPKRGQRKGGSRSQGRKQLELGLSSTSPSALWPAQAWEVDSCEL